MFREEPRGSTLCDVHPSVSRMAFGGCEKIANKARDSLSTFKRKANRVGMTAKFRQAAVEGIATGTLVPIPWATSVHRRLHFRHYHLHTDGAVPMDGACLACALGALKGYIMMLPPTNAMSMRGFHCPDRGE
jgi:hypothetical protein